MKLSEHFSLSEFTRSSTAESLGIDNSLDLNNTGHRQIIGNLRALCAEVLEPLREHIGKPLIISSGYRCKALNKAVGGVANSQHLVGEAADLCIPSVAEAREWMRWLMDNTRFDQLILEHNRHGTHWLHVSHKADADKNRQQVMLKNYNYTNLLEGLPN